MVARRAKGDDDDGAGPKSVVPLYNSKLDEESKEGEHSGHHL